MKQADELRATTAFMQLVTETLADKTATLENIQDMSYMEGAADALNWLFDGESGEDFIKKLNQIMG